MMWRQDVLATAQVDSGTGDNDTQVLSTAAGGPLALRAGAGRS